MPDVERQSNKRRAMLCGLAALAVAASCTGECAALHRRGCRARATSYPQAAYANYGPASTNPVGFGFGGYSYGGYPIYGYAGYLPSAYDGFGGVGYALALPVGLPGGYGIVGCPANVVVGYGGDTCGPRWPWLRLAGFWPGEAPYEGGQALFADGEQFDALPAEAVVMPETLPEALDEEPGPSFGQSL